MLNTDATLFAYDLNVQRCAEGNFTPSYLMVPW